MPISTRLFGLLVLTLGLASCGTTDAPESAGAQPKSTPSAKPAATLPAPAKTVRGWIRAVKLGDKAGFKTAFSEQMQRTHDAQGWDEMLTAYQTRWKEEFNDYKVDDFRFRFDGDQAKGKVIVSYKSEDQPPLAVKNEGGSWKIDQQ